MFSSNKLFNILKPSISSYSCFYFDLSFLFFAFRASNSNFLIANYFLSFLSAFIYFRFKIVLHVATNLLILYCFFILGWIPSTTWIKYGHFFINFFKKSLWWCVLLLLTNLFFSKESQYLAKTTASVVSSTANFS